MSIKITIPNSSSDVLTFGSGNTPTAAQIAGIDSGSSNGQLALYTTASGTSTERVRVDASGNVGIGTSSPSGRTHIVSAAGTVQLKWSDGTNGTANLDTASGVSRIWSNVGLAFGTGAETYTERMRIDSSGNLLVGTTTVGSYTSGIVVGNSSSAKAVTLPVNGGGATFNGVDTVNQPSAGFTIGHITSTSQFACRVGSTGGLQLNGAGATTWTSLSDETTKDIIEPITDAANKVSTLRAVIGKYKTDEEGVRRSFLIAQDVQAVLPEAVSLIKQELGSEETSLGLSYTDVIPLLVAAIKEQQAIITSLTDRITLLENK